MELKEQKVGEIVRDDIRTAHVFKKYGIDFCCGGGISLDEACARKSVSIEVVSRDLALAVEVKDEEQPDFNVWSAAELCDYIEEKHHTYVKENLPVLVAYAEKVASVHGHHHPELVDMRNLVLALNDDLTVHLHKEENILFPNIRHAIQDDTFASRLPFGKFENPVRMMEQDHEVAGDLIKEIRFLSKDYFLPDYACATWRAYFDLLESFEADLFMHIHLENNILHQKARDLDVMA